MSARISVVELQNQIGNEIETTMVLKSKKKNLSEKAEWIEAVFEDNTGTVAAVIWKDSIPKEIDSYVDKVVRLKGKVGIRSGNIQFKVKEINLARDDEVDIAAFAPFLKEEQVEVLEERLKELINSVTDKMLNALLQVVFSSGMIKKLSMLPGGHTHHSFNGGLLVHTIEVAEITDALIRQDEESAIYHKAHVTINRDLAVTGALLHDIGKGKEFLPFPFNKRRENSYFVGFPTVGVSYVDKVFDLIEKHNPGMVYGNIRDYICNMIASCHVTYRDCVPPRTKEAIIVRLADRQSAERDNFDSALYEHVQKNADDLSLIYSDFFKSYIYLSEEARSQLIEQVQKAKEQEGGA